MSAPISAAARPSARLGSLDGLRGLAALVVVGHHLLLASPAIANAVGYPAVGSTRWWLEFTPLKLFTAGPEAVLIFFVLSGMVIVLPVIRKDGFDWLGYYPRRFVRLYLPVLVSVLFAAALILSHPQVLGAEVSAWLGSYSVPSLSLSQVFASLDILATANELNNPLWTLRWEMLFSLALPIYVVLAVRTAKHWVVGGLATAVIVWVGFMTGTGYLQVLPVFYVGALIAVHSDSLRQWAASRSESKWSWLVGSAALVGGALMLIASRLLDPALNSVFGLNALAQVVTLAGATTLVLVSFLWRPAQSVLTIAPMRWLGRVSFSLYLVHVPILIAVANVFGPGQWVPTVAVTLPIALVLAELFYRFVELPAHKLSKRVGATASDNLRARLDLPSASSAVPATGPESAGHRSTTRLDRADS
jgi:peptidoglycan/LPS O-acetylase OafA/YrhL